MRVKKRILKVVTAIFNYFLPKKNISEVGDKSIHIPKDWAMFALAGNKRITALATILVKVIENVDLSKGKKEDALFAFHKGWCLMSNFKIYSEASDTAVREYVSAFLDEMAGIIGFDGNKLWDAY